MVFLVLYELGDFGLFGRTRIERAAASPVIRSLNYRLVDVRQIPSRKRNQVIQESIDQTDFLVIAVGTYTFMHPWTRFAAIYGFTKNRPMLAANNAVIPDGWETDMTRGPNPFSKVKWEIHGPDIRLYSLDTVFEVMWHFRKNVPRHSVCYRLTGEKGCLDDIAPMYDWMYGEVEENVLKWIKRSIWLAGL